MFDRERADAAWEVQVSEMRKQGLVICLSARDLWNRNCFKIRWGWTALEMGRWAWSILVAYKSNHYLAYGAKVATQKPHRKSPFSSFKSNYLENKPQKCGKEFKYLQSLFHCLFLVCQSHRHLIILLSAWVCILSQPQYYCFCSCTFDLRSYMSIGEKTFQRTGFTSSKNGQSHSGLRFKFGSD